MSQDYAVPEPDSGDPWNPDAQNEYVDAIDPIEPPSSDAGMQFIAPGESDTTGEPDVTNEPGDRQTSSPASEAELPPEAQGEVNGGPLGCCLGVTVGVILSLTLAVFGRLYLANPLAAMLNNPLLVLILLRVAMALLTLAAAILCGYFGWKLGKRFFREYEPPVVPVRERRPKRRRRKTSTRPREA